VIFSVYQYYAKIKRRITKSAKHARIVNSYIKLDFTRWPSTLIARGSLNCPHDEMKLKQNSFTTAWKQFWNCFISLCGQFSISPTSALPRRLRSADTRIRFSSVGRALTSATEPSVQLDLESGTICWWTSHIHVCFMQSLKTFLFGQWDQSAVWILL